jgi:hypothetical protein
MINIKIFILTFQKYIRKTGYVNSDMYLLVQIKNNEARYQWLTSVIWLTYLGNWDPEDYGSRPTQANSSQDPSPQSPEKNGQEIWPKL